MPEGPTIVEINDPVAHVRYVFDLGEPVAHRQELPADSSRATSTPAPPDPAPPMIGGPAAGATAPGIGGLGTAPAAATCPAAPSAAKPGRGDDEGPQTAMENLGTQIIEGIPAEGTRSTMKWPVGSVGNDRPITNVYETWMSPDLKEVILSKSDDPRSGEHTHKLVNVSRSEPDPSLFEPPPGYTVKDEEGEFTINWNNAR